MNLTKQSLSIEVWKQFIQNILEHTTVNKKDNTATVLIDKYNNSNSNDILWRCNSTLGIIEKQAENLNIMVQPYILIIGTILGDICNSFISIDDVLYSADSTLQALDICFKVFQVFHMNYPVFSEHL
ncbi:hypothetical protein PUN28_016969 [Cardiocondyla obscurior]|uniref:Uncharacterized protein n=1 Tax=Cardiocondyla obscurior TaxID=286306 RepID=A0AAW2EMF9_9HYME